MLVFWRQRLVFLATPKTASTAIESVLAPLAAVVILRPPQLKHTNAQRYQKMLAPFLGDAKGDEFAMTALMREPQDWLSSWYRYRQRPEEVPEKSTRDLSFDDFVRAYCREDQPEFARVGSQATFLAPKNHRPVDHVFRYEDIDDFVLFLQDRLNTRFDLPRLNVSPAGDGRLGPATAALLRQHCRRDFEIYDMIGPQ